jgi:UDP-N-acetylmuramyl pentapeptide phosphotransferase/UDP-N-acetylglucosamine-1-phosphate transferase
MQRKRLDRASLPEWVQPTPEGGGSRILFGVILFVVLWLQFTSCVCFCFCDFFYTAKTAEGL